MTPQTPEEYKYLFELFADAHNCVITKFDPINRIIEFNGADNDLEKLAQYIADHTE